MNFRQLSATLVLAGIFLLVGCDQPLNQASLNKAKSSYDLAVQSGVLGQPYPREFNAMFPNAMNGISYYTGLAGPSKWGSKASFHSRYVIKMEAAVEFDSARTNIVSMSVPTFYLYELPKIVPSKDGLHQPSIQINQLATFSGDSWHRLVNAKGDFGVLGLTLETNKPVEGFDGAWKGFW